jgi:hypothetical protein
MAALLLSRLRVACKRIADRDAVWTLGAALSDERLPTHRARWSCGACERIRRRRRAGVDDSPPGGAHELRPAGLRERDALVEAWLPGSEGEGVADPLFGRTSNSGKLRVAWPRMLAQEPIYVDDRDYDRLYPCGFGLRR